MDSTSANDLGAASKQETNAGSHEAQAHRACDFCRRRKVRCSGTQPCQHCRRTNALCTYSTARGRLALLERSLQQSQQRIKQLEASLKLYSPHTDPTTATPVAESEKKQCAERDLCWTTTTADVNVSPQPNVSTTGPEDILSSDEELDTTDLLEWNETFDLDISTDGFGSLALSAELSGYMGPQSGIALLRYLQSANNFLSDDGMDFHSTTLPTTSIAPDVIRAKVASPSFRSNCVDWYFAHYHKAYPLLHEGTFRAEFMGAIPKPRDGSWPVLSNMVLAFGALVGPESCIGADVYLFNQSRASLSMDLLQGGSVRLVQTFALMANYLQKRNKPNSGFTYLGIALNMALSLGLHREFSDKSISPFTMEIRRRVWWTLYIFDSGARLTFGRPSMSLHGANVRTPRNLDDSEIAVDMETLPMMRDHPTATTCLIWQCKLAGISNAVSAKLLEQNVPPESEISDLDNKLVAWWEALPSYFKQPLKPEFEWFDIPRMILRWRAVHLRIVMTRPFILETIRQRRVFDLSENKSMFYRCTNASQECIQSIVCFYSEQTTYPGALAWYATYWLVTAVFLLATCIVYEPYHSTAGLWRSHIENAKQTLGNIAAIEPIAGRAISILRKIMDLVPQTPALNTIMSNQPLRMEVADIWSESWLNNAGFVEDDFGHIGSDAEVYQY